MRPLPGAAALGVQPVPVLVRKRVRRDGRRRERAWLLPPLLSPLPPPAQPPQTPPAAPSPLFSWPREKLPAGGVGGQRPHPGRHGLPALPPPPRHGPPSRHPRIAAHRSPPAQPPGDRTPPRRPPGLYPPPNPRPCPEPPPPPAGQPRALGAGTSRRHRPLKAAFSPVRSVLCRQGNNLKMRCNCFLR